MQKKSLFSYKELKTHIEHGLAFISIIRVCCLTKITQTQIYKATLCTLQSIINIK